MSLPFSTSSQAQGQGQHQPNPKQRLISSLASQLALLAERTAHLDRLTATTAEQAKYMRSLGGLHAGWFMAANRVLTPNDVDVETEGQQHSRGEREQEQEQDDTVVMG